MRVFMIFNNPLLLILVLPLNYALKDCPLLNLFCPKFSNDMEYTYFSIVPIMPKVTSLWLAPLIHGSFFYFYDI